MNNKNKVISLVLGVTMVGTLLSSCKKSTGDPERIGTITPEELNPEKIGYYSTLKLPLTDVPTKITMMSDTSSTDLDSTDAMTELRRRTGVDIEIMEIPRSTIKDKAKVLLASQSDMPDVFLGALSVEETNDFGMSGGFEPIDPYFDKLPNFNEIFITNAEKNGTQNSIKDYRAADGNLYIFMGYDCERYVNHGMLYRKDIFDKHNIPMWNNKEEYYQALKKLKGIYPNSTPMVSKTQLTIFKQLGQSWGLDYPLPYYDEETSQWKHTLTDEKFKDMLDYMKKLYDEQLLDKEFITATQATWTSKMTQKEAAFTTFDWIGRLDMFKEQTKSTVPEYDLRYGNPIGPTGKVITLPKTTGGPAFKKGDNSLLAMQVCDYLISPSGAQLMTLGIEGKTYTMGEDGFADYIDMDNSKAIGINELEAKYGMFASGIYKRFDRRSTYFNYSPKEKEAQELMLNKDGGGFLPIDPSLSLNKEEKEVRSKYQTALHKAADEFVTKYILSDKTGDGEWQAWLKQADELGANEIVDAYNTAQKRYNQ